MKLLRITASTAALMTAAVMSITSPAQAQARLAWWGWPGVVGYPGYGYVGYPAMAMAPFTATQRMATAMGPATAIRSTSHIAPRVDTGCGITRGTVPPITPLSDAVFPYGPAPLVLGVIGSKSRPKYRRRCFDFCV